MDANKRCRYARPFQLFRQLGMASVTDSHVLRNTKVWQGHGLGGTLLVENLAAISTMMFTIRKGEGSPAA